MQNITKSWSTLTIKSFDEDKRVITGIASTPSTDRDGDIVEPRGAKFNLPYPLLYQHNHSEPIGEVVKSRVTSAGIEIVAHIAKNSELNYLNIAWEQIRTGLIKGLSIGFRGINVKKLPGGGLHFKTYEIFELSAVTVPAQQEASITSIKHYCNASCQKKSADFGTRKANVIKRAEAYLADHHKPKDA